MTLEPFGRRRPSRTSMCFHSLSQPSPAALGSADDLGMVLLRMTPAIVAAVERHQALAETRPGTDPSLDEPAEGKPISHFQLVDISKQLLSHVGPEETVGQGCDRDQYRLNNLLRGAKFYAPPPPPKPEPTAEYKALMARLRAAQEAQSYSQMLNPAPESQTFYQRFPNARPITLKNDGTNDDDDELTYADINRQLTLVFNVLVSVVACAAALWLAARHWSTPARLFLSMSGSIVVAVAEVGVYMGYIRRLGEAKAEEKKKSKTETREVLDTWVIEGKGKEAKPMVVGQVLGADPKDRRIRLRRKKEGHGAM